MNAIREFWRDATPRSFYTRTDLVLDLFLATAIAVGLFVVLAAGLDILWS